MSSSTPAPSASSAPRTFGTSADVAHARRPAAPRPAPRRRRPSPAPPSATRTATASMRVHPGGDQRLDQPHPVVDRDRRLGLQPVARPDVADRRRRRAARQRHQTGGTPWRRSEKWRSLPSASARRRTSSRAQVVEVDDGVDHQLGGQPVEVDVLLVELGAARRRRPSRSSGSSMAAILLANTALTAASGPITAILAVGRASVASGSKAGPGHGVEPGAVGLAHDHRHLRHGGLGRPR